MSGDISKKIVLWPVLEKLLPVFSSKIFIISGLTFRSLIHFFKKILFEREKEGTEERAKWGGVGWRGAEQREKQTPHTAGSPTWALIPGPWDHDLS